ncbi:MAG: cytochrome c [Hylemonella sp.]|nr:cytochrome c [Hylemonella sp.]
MNKFILGGVLFALSAAAQADAAAGKLRAATACAVCHGPQGLSTQPNAPHLAGQPEIYLVEQLRNYRSGKRPHEVMGVIAKTLSNQDIDDLAQWYASIPLRVGD